VALLVYSTGQGARTDIQWLRNIRRKEINQKPEAELYTSVAVEKSAIQYINSLRIRKPSVAAAQ